MHIEKLIPKFGTCVSRDFSSQEKIRVFFFLLLYKMLRLALEFNAMKASPTPLQVFFQGVN